MLAKCFRSDSGSPLGRVILTAMVILLLPAVVSTAPQPTSKVLECNSDIIIGLPGSISPGVTFPVTLTVVSGPSNDAADAPVPQAFDKITFWPSCTTTLPCVPDTGPPQPVVFVGPISVGAPCVETAMASGGPTEFDFDFAGGPVAGALTVPAAASGSGTESCDVTFDVMVDGDFTGSIAMQASTDGVCDPGGLDLNSSADATANLTVVPTLGEMGLFVLALLLVCGSWVILRRRAVA